MSRAQRLLDLMQVLRRHRFAVTGETLAAELGVSVRTVYRDIATLQAQGAHIDGAAGVGYVLQPGFMLPPLMFSEDEIEALILGMRWVAGRADSELSLAARNATAKIADVLPNDLRHVLQTSTLLVPPGEPVIAGTVDLALVRRAIRAERKMSIDYRDLKERESSRTLWPFALGFYERVRVVVAWCEMRRDFRHFRADRISRASVLEERYPRRREALLREWRRAEGIPLPA